MSRRLRAVFGAVLATVATACLVLTMPGAAQAKPQIPCPPGVLGVAADAVAPDGSPPPVRVAFVYSLLSAVETFNVSDSRVVVNSLATPVTATFTAQESRTWQLSVTVGSSASLFGFLTASVSTAIVQSRTTSLGVSATATVPANGTVYGRYGVVAYDIAYQAQEIHVIANSTCVDFGTRQGTANAPTAIEGWRITAG